MKKIIFSFLIFTLAFSFGVVVNAQTLTLDAPVLISPANDAVVRGDVLLSDWSDVSGATKYLYNSYHDAAASSLRYKATYAVSEKPAYNVPNTELWWRVKALDSLDNESPWSDLWHITIDNDAPLKVGGMTIKQDGLDLGCGATVSDRLITVDWEDSIDPNFSHYKYQADDGVDPIDYNTTSNVSERSGQIRDLDGTYQYRVSAVDKAANVGDWSDWCYITLDRFVRNAEITSPVDAEEVGGIVLFSAILNDKGGDDVVSWAVRKGTCAAGTNTVFGNVDGFHNDFDWDGVNFQASTDTSLWIPGEYCFIFNPSESAGDMPIRETREFVVLDVVAPVITLVEPINGETYGESIPFEATCNEECDYVNFWWTKVAEPFSSADKQYHYVRENGLEFSWTIEDLFNAEKADGTTYEMDDGEYYVYAAGKDVAGNWTRTERRMIIVDKDLDGVLGDDICSGTDVDDFEKMSPIHYAWHGENPFYMEEAKGKKAKANEKKEDYSIADTHGCSCLQILDWLNYNYPEEFGELEGLRKHGCSSGIMKDFIELSSL